jgi:tetratricopeptide (TPR) repeat protein
MNWLLVLYAQAGRYPEGIAILAKSCAAAPKNTDVSLTLATWQAWFGQDADYEATRRRLVQQAEGTDQAGTAERAAKAACLRPSSDHALLAKALLLARRGVELGAGSSSLPYYQLGLGLAEYRNDQYGDAEQMLAIAEQKFGDGYNPEYRALARLVRAMSLLHLGKLVDARELFSQAEAEMPPYPGDENKPTVDPDRNHDELICWLVYKEAKALVKGVAKATNQPK